MTTTTATSTCGEHTATGCGWGATCTLPKGHDGKHEDHWTDRDGHDRVWLAWSRSVR